MREGALFYGNDAERVRHRGAQLGTIYLASVLSGANAARIAAEQLRALRQLSCAVQLVRIKQHRADANCGVPIIVMSMR